MLELSLGDRFQASNSMIDVDTKFLPPSALNMTFNVIMIFTVIMIFNVIMTFVMKK
jgi:hypothetical protein